VVDSLEESKIIYQSVALASDTIASFEIDNLPAGTYKIYAGDQGAVKAVKTVKLVNPLPLTVTISAPDSMCNGYDATLTANASGRDANTTLSYVWESSTDSAAWITLPVNTQSTTSTISENKYFRVYVCDNYCETNSLVKVNVNNTPNCKVATNVVNTEKESAIIIYPNPAKTAFTIQTGQAENEVKVFDMKGAIILQQSVADKSHINVSAWEKGTYIVEINNKKVKLIKE